MKIKPIKLSDKLTIDGNVFLAPLAGVTDVGFRYICRLTGAHLSFTEMISAKGLAYGNKNTSRMLSCEPIEKPKAVQLFGSDAEIMSDICSHEYLDDFDIIDINMGCPVPKVVKNGEGSALMQTPELASKIISRCVLTSKRPVTVKFRKGFDEENINCVEFAKMCEDSGASLITVHGRLRSEFYSGTSDRIIIEKVKNSVKIPVIASGDVFSVKDADEICSQTGVDGILVARGSLGNPNIFAELTSKPQLELKYLILEHLRVLAKHTDERFAVLNMRKHLLWYLDKIKGGKSKKLEASALIAMTDTVNFINQTF